MSDKRIEDFGKQRTWYRSDRMMEQNGQWYYLTREGTIEGPYDTRLKAVGALEAFIEAKALGLLSQADELSLSPVGASYKR
jgi:hypothetical protein